MKKLISLMLIALMGTVASAVTIKLQGPAEVKAGDVVSISLYSDTAVGAFTIVSVTDGGASGLASNPAIAAGFDFAMFNNNGVLNTSGLLIQNATGKTGFGSPLLSGVLYTFDYTVASDITAKTITLSVSGNAGGTAIEALTMNVVPEPITVALLGLGGLFIRRRK